MPKSMSSSIRTYMPTYARNLALTSKKFGQSVLTPMMRDHLKTFQSRVVSSNDPHKSMLMMMLKNPESSNDKMHALMQSSPYPEDQEKAYSFENRSLPQNSTGDLIQQNAGSEHGFMMPSFLAATQEHIHTKIAKAKNLTPYDLLAARVNIDQSMKVFQNQVKAKRYRDSLLVAAAQGAMRPKEREHDELSSLTTQEQPENPVEAIDDPRARIPRRVGGAPIAIAPRVATYPHMEVRAVVSPADDPGFRLPPSPTIRTRRIETPSPELAVRDDHPQATAYGALGPNVDVPTHNIPRRNSAPDIVAHADNAQAVAYGALSPNITPKRVNTQVSATPAFATAQQLLTDAPTRLQTAPREQSLATSGEAADAQASFRLKRRDLVLEGGRKALAEKTVKRKAPYALRSAKRSPVQQYDSSLLNTAGIANPGGTTEFDSAAEDFLPRPTPVRRLEDLEQYYTPQGVVPYAIDARTHGRQTALDQLAIIPESQAADQVEQLDNPQTEPGAMVAEAVPQPRQGVAAIQVEALGSAIAPQQEEPPIEIHQRLSLSPLQAGPETERAMEELATEALAQGVLEPEGASSRIADAVGHDSRRRADPEDEEILPVKGFGYGSTTVKAIRDFFEDQIDTTKLDPTLKDNLAAKGESILGDVSKAHPIRQFYRALSHGREGSPLQVSDPLTAEVLHGAIARTLLRETKTKLSTAGVDDTAYTERLRDNNYYEDFDDDLSSAISKTPHGSLRNQLAVAFRALALSGAYDEKTRSEQYGSILNFGRDQGQQYDNEFREGFHSPSVPDLVERSNTLARNPLHRGTLNTPFNEFVGKYHYTDEARRRYTLVTGFRSLFKDEKELGKATRVLLRQKDEASKFDNPRDESILTALEARDLLSTKYGYDRDRHPIKSGYKEFGEERFNDARAHLQNTLHSKDFDFVERRVREDRDEFFRERNFPGINIKRNHKRYQDVSISPFK